MNIFEKMFGGPKDVSSGMEEKKPETTEPVKEESKNKTLDDIRRAQEDLGALQSKRQELLNKHRDNTAELADLGVREIPTGGVTRSETFNQILNPLEEELLAISSEINEERTEFDLQPHRTEILKNRMERLEELRNRDESEFAKTEIGQKIGELKSKTKEIDEQMKQYSREGNIYSTDLISLEKEKNEVAYKINRIFLEDKIANTHAIRIDRINRLINDIEINTNDAKNTSYDENGQIRVK